MPSIAVAAGGQSDLASGWRSRVHTPKTSTIDPGRLSYRQALYQPGYRQRVPTLRSNSVVRPRVIPFLDYWGGFTLLAGGVLLKPRIDASVPQSQNHRYRAVGSRAADVDGQFGRGPAGLGPWAGGIAYNRLSSRPETLDDQTWLPPLTTLDANVRYRWKWGDGSATLSLGVTNLLNAQGLRLIAPYFIVWPEPDRSLALTLTTDL